MQEIIVWSIVLIALVYVIRNVLKQLSALFGKRDEGCPGCGTCAAAKRSKSTIPLIAKPKGHATVVPTHPRKGS